MTEPLEIKHTLTVGQTYKINLMRGCSEISLLEPDEHAYLPFKVTSNGSIKRGGLQDEVDINLVPAYLKSVYGIELDEKALAELGISSNKK